MPGSRRAPGGRITRSHRRFRLTRLGVLAGGDQKRDLLTGRPIATDRGGEQLFRTLMTATEQMAGGVLQRKAPDGICLDREAAVWVASFEDAFIRIGRDGEELQRMEVPGRRAIACVLGGPERRTLFCLSAATSYEELRQRKSSARIDVIDVEIPGVGYP